MTDYEILNGETEMETRERERQESMRQDAIFAQECEDDVLSLSDLFDSETVRNMEREHAAMQDESMDIFESRYC
jgi:hypothetical protein